MEDQMREESAGVEGCTPPKHGRYPDEGCSNASNFRGSPMIAAHPTGRGRIRGVPRKGGVGGPPDLRNRPANPAAPSPPPYHVTVEELKGIVRHARLARGGSFSSSPSSSETSHATQHSHQSNHSGRSHASQHCSRHGSRDNHRSRHCSRHRCISRSLPIPYSVLKFKRGG